MNKQIVTSNVHGFYRYLILLTTHDMIGAITGDIIGSTCEFNDAGRYDFDPFPPGSVFTDDTVLTTAIDDAILSSREYSENFEDAKRKAIWPGGDSDTLPVSREELPKHITGKYQENGLKNPSISLMRD